MLNLELEFHITIFFYDLFLKIKNYYKIFSLNRIFFHSQHLCRLTIQFLPTLLKLILQKHSVLQRFIAVLFL